MISSRKRRPRNSSDRLLLTPHLPDLFAAYSLRHCHFCLFTPSFTLISDRDVLGLRLLAIVLFDDNVFACGTLQPELTRSKPPSDPFSSSSMAAHRSQLVLLPFNLSMPCRLI